MNKNKCKNRVVIEISVSQLLKCRLSIGELTPLFKEMLDILHCLQPKNEDDYKTLAYRISQVCYDYRQTIENIEEVKKNLPLLNSLFSYDDKD